MKTYEDIYIMMCNALYEYLNINGCYDTMFCHKCDYHSFCGIDSIHIAKRMIFEY